jgi:hypothetical protein
MREASNVRRKQAGAIVVMATAGRRQFAEFIDTAAPPNHVGLFAPALGIA